MKAVKHQVSFFVILFFVTMVQSSEVGPKLLESSSFNSVSIFWLQAQAHILWKNIQCVTDHRLRELIEEEYRQIRTQNLLVVSPDLSKAHDLYYKLGCRVGSVLLQQRLSVVAIRESYLASSNKSD